MVDKNDALFREVEEELRREQYQRLWQRYGTYIIGFAVLVVVAVAGAKYMESHRLSVANTAGADFQTATELATSKKYDEALKQFQSIAETGPNGYATLAALSEAGVYLKQDKRPEALKVFEKIAADSSTDPLLANYARLQAASLRLGEADFTEMQNRLTPLIGDDSSWRYTARELLGMAAIKAGKLDEARKTLAPLLADPGLTRTATERIERLMATIATAELSAKEAPAASGPVPTQVPAAADEAGKPAP